MVFHSGDEQYRPRGQGSRKHLSAQDKVRFREVLEATGSVPKAAAAIGISLPTAYQLARAFGWQPQPGGSGSRISADQRQQFHKVLDRTHRVKDAAAAIGISLPTAYQLAKAAGWSSPRSGPRGPLQQYTADDRQRVMAAYDRLGNVAAVARAVGIGYVTCRSWLIAAGVVHPRTTAGKREAFLALRAQGLTRHEAAGAVGDHPRTADDYDAGVRRTGNARIYPDGQVVDYTTGITTLVTPQQPGLATKTPAVDHSRGLAAPIDPRYLSLQDRERIYELRLAGDSIRTIATHLGRSPSTVSREVHRNSVDGQYFPFRAHRDATARRLRPKPAKLAVAGPLRDQVTHRLALGHSPEQISHRLVKDYPNNPAMRVCHKTIYQAIYLQARGGLKREVQQALRTGRARRKPTANTAARTSRFRDPMINISARPPQVADRAVPGHWEGDLITGQHNRSAIGTLVERTTRFTMLLHLPQDHTAPTVRDALITTMHDLPKHLKGSLTWDQGAEMALHKAFATTTEMDVYFCDPASPWQRGTTENTNGLLRQYFPKGHDLAAYTPDDLAHAALLLNTRPRKTLGWDTPAERMHQLLLDH